MVSRINLFKRGCLASAFSNLFQLQRSNDVDVAFTGLRLFLLHGDSGFLSCLCGCMVSMNADDRRKAVYFSNREKTVSVCGGNTAEQYGYKSAFLHVS